MNDEINYIAVGAKIRESREKAKLTQEKLAEICTLSTAHIGHIERGTRIPSLNAIFKIAVILQISIDGLLLGSCEGESLCNADNVTRHSDKLKLKSLLADTHAMIDEIGERIESL